MAYDNTIDILPDPYTGGGIGFTSASLKAISTGTSNPLNGGGTISTIFKGGYWEITVSYPDTLQHELDTILPFLHSLEGSFRSFYITLPQHRFPRTGEWNVSSPAKIAMGDMALSGTSTVHISKWSTRGGDLNPGDMFKFTNMAKIYSIVRKDYSPALDEVALTLNTPVKYPSLVAAAGIEPNEIKFKVILKDNSVPSPVLQTNGIYSGFTLTMRENILDQQSGEQIYPAFTWYSKATGLILCDEIIDCTEEPIQCQ